MTSRRWVRRTRLLPLLAGATVLGLRAQPGVAGRTTTIFMDDFEKDNAWTFSARSPASEQRLDTEVFHRGKRALSSVTDRFELMNHRPGLRFTESRARLAFWCYADYEGGDEFWIRLVIGATREGAAQASYVSLRPPPPRVWERREVLLEEISPALAGTIVSGVQLGLRGRGTALKLVLDDVSLENHTAESVWKPRLQPVKSSPANLGPLSWVAKDKVRAVFAAPRPREGPRYRDLFAAPVNTVFLASPDPAVIVEWAGRCTSYGKHLFVVAPAFPLLESVAMAKELRRAQFADGLNDDVVCPRDVRYWERSFSESMRELAELARLVNIEGCLLDLRLPGKQHPAFSMMEACLCDDCFDAFLRDQKSLERAALVPVAGRRDLLARRGWLRDFAVWQEAAMIDIARPLAHRLRTTHPNFVLGVFAYEDFWLARGLATGFASTGIPALIVSAEPARSEGYNLRVRELTETVRRFGFPALCVPGLAVERLDARLVVDQLMLTALGADGFWVTAPPGTQEGAITQLAGQLTAAFHRLRDTVIPSAPAVGKAKS